MSEVKTYAVNCNDAWLNTDGDDISDSYVKYADYAALQAKCAALVAENEGLKAAFDKPQAYLSWHAIPPTWEDPLPFGEYLDVHDDAGHKNSDGTDCWPVYSKHEIDTTATDALLAEVRAQGVEMAMEHMQSSGSLTFGDCYISLNEFATKLRESKGVQS